MTIGPRDRTELTTRRPPGRRRLPPRSSPRSPSHHAEAADGPAGVARLLAARGALHGCPVRASTRFKYRPLRGGKSPDRRARQLDNRRWLRLSGTEVLHDHRSTRADSLPCVCDHGLRLDPRPVLELVDHVPVPGQRQARVVAKLARHRDDAPSLVEQQRSCGASRMGTRAPDQPPASPD